MTVRHPSAARRLRLTELRIIRQRRPTRTASLTDMDDPS
jgi:hypothetical protein